MEEELFDIPEFEGLYAITKTGRVFAYERIIKYETHNRIQKSHWLKPTFHKRRNYISIYMTKDKKGYDICLHMLLAKIFIPNPESKKFVEHINGISSDNRLENLRWTNQPNYWKKRHKAVICIETGQMFESMTNAAKFYNTTVPHIIHAIHRNGILAGFHWDYLENHNDNDDELDYQDDYEETEF